MFTVGNVDRYIDCYISRRSGRQSFATRSLLDRHLVDCQLSIDQVAIDRRPTGDRHSFSGHRYLADTWPILDRHLADTPPLLDRYLTQSAKSLLAIP